jgi:hypothetical protein
MKHLSLYTLFIIALLCSSSSFAWGPTGHKLICAIAYRSLDKPLQEKIDQLTENYRTPDGKQYKYFTGGCTLADLARSKAKKKKSWQVFKPFKHWHYLNVPRTTQTIERGLCEKQYGKDDCILLAIEYHSQRLKNKSLSDQQRAEALFLLAHWVGDIHQPLHVAFSDDAGGYAIKLKKGGFYPSNSLHQVWDSGIVKKVVGKKRWWDYSEVLLQAALTNKTDQWLNSTPLDWAQESFNVASSERFDYCQWKQGACVSKGNRRLLSVQYQKEYAEYVEQRLQQAGLRLAELIKESL